MDRQDGLRSNSGDWGCARRRGILRRSTLRRTLRAPASAQNNRQRCQREEFEPAALFHDVITLAESLRAPASCITDSRKATGHQAYAENASVIGDADGDA